ncbi:ELAV-like protein 1 isoform X2 [Telopea speciosissima]|uniref:ELAV-like protein 1 isoform X2 n=1 Tax=Telopea speciosissima TaxID=54955 RepID=UPI001CC4CB33|nr:ELAV-like protein 1 isoform X2 [Telopea speciosissima]
MVDFFSTGSERLATMCPAGKKLVVLGLPWDVDTEGLRQYMSQFGELADVMVMKDRASGRSHGFGYVTFSSLEDVEKAVAAQHHINGRTLEVKVATPKEEMLSSFSSKKSTRIFVARVPPSVGDDEFHSYFMKYGPVIDVYMPKDPVTKQHRGIGFVTYENHDSVDQLMSETHELGGSTIAVDRATPKEEFRGSRVSNHYLKMPQTFRMSNIVENTISVGNNGGHAAESSLTRTKKKMFIGHVPAEATSDDLHAYFSQFGWVVDVYLPKDPKKVSHRGFGFVTFADEASAARVARRRHFIHGREIAVDSASPTDHVHDTGHIPVSPVPYFGGQHGLPPNELVVGATTEGENATHPSTASSSKWGKKLFIGRIPVEATAIDVRLHFSQFGHVLDVYLPKDDTKTSHRGFGFITFAEEISAEYASQKVHRILGQKIVLDRAAPLENDETSTNRSSAVVAAISDHSIHTQQNLFTHQPYDSKLMQFRDTSTSQPFRTSLRYGPY